jgi:hypothetical protein
MLAVLTLNSTKRRRRIRFSVASLFILILAAAVVFGWAQYRLRAFADTWRRIEIIRSKGGYAETQPIENHSFWSAMHFGNDEELVRPTKVALDRWKVVDDDLELLRGWESLDSLTIQGDGVTDAGMEHLVSLKHLGELGLFCRNVTDAGFSLLRHIDGIQSLKLSDTSITAASLRQFDLTNLRNIGLPPTVSPDIVAQLIQCAHLEELFWICPSIGDSDMNALASIQGLRTLELIGPRISASAFQAIISNNSLRAIDIPFYRASESDLCALSRCESLDHVALDFSGVPRETVELVRESLSRERRVPFSLGDSSPPAWRKPLVAELRKRGLDIDF